MKLREVKLSAEGLKQTKAHEWVLRFVFGGLVSLVAGLVGQKAGPVVGGLFLGFPSILPATITLVMKHRGRVQAVEDARGAALGGVGLVAFAFLLTATAERWGEAVSLASATGAWLLVSIISWMVAA